MTEVCAEMAGCYRVTCALSVPARISVSNITFDLTVHLPFIWLLIRVAL